MAHTHGTEAKIGKIRSIQSCSGRLSLEYWLFVIRCDVTVLRDYWFSGCSIDDIECSGCSIDDIEYSGCSIDCGGCSIIVAWCQLPHLVGRYLYLSFVVYLTRR